MDPYPPGILFRLLAGSYSAAGRHDEALKAYEKTLKLNPNDIFTHVSLAALYVELGDSLERACEKAVAKLAEIGGRGGVIAISHKGEVAHLHNTNTMDFALARG